MSKRGPEYVHVGRARHGSAYLSVGMSPSQTLPDKHRCLPLCNTSPQIPNTHTPTNRTNVGPLTSINRPLNPLHKKNHFTAKL